MDIKKIAAKIVKQYGKIRDENNKQYEDLISQGRDPYEYGMLVENGHSGGVYKNEVLTKAVNEVLSKVK